MTNVTKGYDIYQMCMVGLVCIMEEAETVFVRQMPGWNKGKC